MKKAILPTLIILLAGLAIAVPQIPHVIVGTVSNPEDSSFNFDSYQITAEVNGYPFTAEINNNNEFEIMIDANGVGAGSEVKFYIGNLEASSSERVFYEVAGYDVIDVEVSIANEDDIEEIVCGNGIKEATEKCDGFDLGFATCENVMSIEFGLTGYTGAISCTDSCTFDTTQCKAPVTITSTSDNNGVSNSRSSGGGSSGGSSSSGGTQYSYSNTADPANENPETQSNPITFFNNQNSVTGAVIGGGTALIIIAVIAVLAILFALIYVANRVKR